ncbi:MAG: hypothetical protein J7K63_06110 [Candidatus Marinimicrobia bacterium]|nr:hypothetical protein [Candidatus Neomarinimicrobiota bacterium]
MKFANKLILIFLVCALPLAADVSFRSETVGMSSLWSRKDNLEINGGVLWIPELQFSWPARVNVDFFLSSRFSGTWDSYEKHQSDGDLYRTWLRVAGNTWDLRGGLQKISFGPARLFRPLMWFDELNPADLLGLTDGVWGLRGRYFFPANTNVWGWVLYGNSGLKGMEWYPTLGNTVEYGGRFQFPMTPGEWGFSVHSRIPDGSPDIVDSTRQEMNDNTREWRVGFDGYWDVVTGVWFESVITHSPADPSLPWVYSNVIGVDYTFPLGSGLYILGEYGFTHTFDDDFNAIHTTNMWGLMLDYPFSFFSTISALGVWLPDEDLVSGVISWQYTSGNFTYYVQYLQTFTRNSSVSSAGLNIPYDTQIKGMLSWTISK